MGIAVMEIGCTGNVHEQNARGLAAAVDINTQTRAACLPATLCISRDGTQTYG